MKRGLIIILIFGIIFIGLGVVNANPGSCTITDSQTLDANFDCSGQTLNITSSGTLKTNNFNITAENIWLEGTLDADGAFINVTGNWTHLGTFTRDTSTVMMTGTGTLTYDGYLRINNFEIAFPTYTTTLHRNRTSSCLIYIYGNLTSKGGNASTDFYLIILDGVNDNYTLHGYPYPDTFYEFEFSWASTIPIPSLTMGGFTSLDAGLTLGGDILVRNTFKIDDLDNFDSAGYNINVGGQTRVHGTGVLNITNGTVFTLSDQGFYSLESDSTVNVKNSTAKFTNFFASNWLTGATLNFENSNITTGDGEQWLINVDNHASDYNFTNCNISYGNNYGTEIIDVQGNINGGNNTPASLWLFGPTIANESVSSTSSNVNITFYANVNSSGEIDSVWLAAGFNDSWQTYPVTNNVGDLYNITINSGNFSAGEFVRYRFYANDSLGNEEYGNLQSFQITTDNVTLFYDNFAYPNTTTLKDWSTKSGTPRITNEFLNLSHGDIIYLANYSNKSYYNLSARFRRGGNIDQTGYGIIYFLYNDTEDSGRALLLRQTGLIQIYGKKEGSWGYRLDQSSLDKDNDWHDINLVVEGNRIRVYLDANSTPAIDFSWRFKDYLQGTVGFSSYVWETDFDNITLKSINLLKIVPINTPITHQSKEAKMFFDIYSTYAVNNISMNVSDTLGNIFTKNISPSNCSGIDTNLFCNVSFLDDFSGLSTSLIGRYNVTIYVSSLEDSETINTYFDVKETPEFAFVHMADNHYGGYGAEWDYNERINNFVNDINNNASFLLPDFVIIEGDITEHGTLSELNASKSYYDNLTIPYYPIVGNHDTSNEEGEEKGHSWADIFGEDRLNYTWDYGGYLFISVDDSSPYGGLGSSITSEEHQLWLQSVLNNNSNTPALLFYEYALAKSRDAGGSVGWMLNDSTTRAKLEAHGGVLGGFFGQAHLNGKTEINNISYIITASLASWPCEYRYVQIYKDRIEINIMRNSGGCVLGLSSGSTDSTHNITEYDYGLESERNFNITIVNKTFLYNNDGTRTENSITLDNLWNFSVSDLDVTFTMPYSGSCTYTASEGTATNSDTGTGCEVTVTLDLDAYQTKTINVSPLVSSSTDDTTSSGSGTGTYKPSKSSLENGFSANVVAGQKVRVIYGDDKTKDVEVKSVSEEKVVVSVDGVHYEISSSASGKIDLDNDGYYDLEISNNKVYSNGIANLKFFLINEEVVSEEEESSIERIVDNVSNAVKTLDWYVYVIIGVVIVLIIVGIVIAKRRK